MPDFCVFFFSSRRRHTRCLSDWSSDVCSSDLRACDGCESCSLHARLLLPLRDGQSVIPIRRISSRAGGRRSRREPASGDRRISPGFQHRLWSCPRMLRYRGFTGNQCGSSLRRRFVAGREAPRRSPKSLALGSVAGHGPGGTGAASVVREVELGPQGSLMVVGRLGPQVICHQLIRAEIGEPQPERRLTAQIRCRFHGSPPVYASVDQDDWIGARPQLYLGTAAISKRLSVLYVGLALCRCSGSGTRYPIVITGLVPVIPPGLAMPCLPKRDGRDKPGHDRVARVSTEVENAVAPLAYRAAPSGLRRCSAVSRCAIRRSSSKGLLRKPIAPAASARLRIASSG